MGAEPAGGGELRGAVQQRAGGVQLTERGAQPGRHAPTLHGVIEGGSKTVRVNLWTAAGAMLLRAVISKAYVPPLPASGMPASDAVPSPLSLNATPAGSEPSGIDSRVVVG